MVICNYNRCPHIQNKFKKNQKHFLTQHGLEGKDLIILHLKCLHFHSEMLDKCWNNTVSTWPLTQIGCSLLDNKGSDCYIEHMLEW